MTAPRLEVRPYALPLRRPVRGRAVRRGWLVRLVAPDGADAPDARGHGDAACWPGFGAGVRATRRALRALAADPAPAARALAAARAGDLAGVAAALAGVPAPEARHAVELAALDLAGRERGAALAATLAAGAPPRPAVLVGQLVADADEARAALALGVRAVKVKLGPDAAGDRARVAAVRAAVGEVVRVRLDANGAWSAGEAVARLRDLADLRPEYVEQPVAPGDLAGLARVRREAPVPVAVDEGVPDLAALDAHLRARAVDVLVLKPQAAGGVLAARALARRARAGGARVVVTHALDSAVGRAGALALAAALPDDGPHGLGPVLARDLAALPPVRGGRVAVPDGPGLGVSFEGAARDGAAHDDDLAGAGRAGACTTTTGGGRWS